MSTDQQTRDPEPRRDGPYFTGVTTYDDPQGRYSVRYPTDWHQFEPIGDQAGVIFSPQPQNPTTWFSVLISPVGESVVAEDIDTLRAGLEEGLRSLPELRLEHEAEDVLGNLVKFERVYTLREGDAVRKRKVWTLYVDTWLFVLAYQGETEAEYAYWLPMGNYCLTTFVIPEALWFATDRDLAGNPRQASPE